MTPNSPSKGEFMSKRMIDSELIDSLVKDVHFDGMGNLTVGKNLEVGGTIKANSGLKPIHSYDVADGTKFDVLFEIPSPDGFTTGFGYIYSGEDQAFYPGMFTYQLTNGKLTAFRGMDNYSIYSWDEGGGLKVSAISTTDTAQAPLYMHQITLDNAAGESKRFQYITSYQVVANSVGELTRLLNGRDVYLDTVQILHKTGNDWRIVGGGGDFLVSTVSDIMTPLEN